MQKLDPYINVDPGTMNPFEHGEVFVTDDGGETDLDLGHYERFIDDRADPRRPTPPPARSTRRCSPPSAAATTSGKTVQVIPHITDEIKRRIRRLATDDVDVVITEVGGTVGDIEILPFLEAIRQFRLDVGRDNVFYVHVTLVPVHRPVGRAEDQAHAALGHRAAQPGHPARRHRVPQRAAASPTTLKRKISNLCDVPVDGGGQRRRRREPLRDPAGAARRGPRRLVCRYLRLDPTAPTDLTDWTSSVAASRRGRAHRCASASSAST